MTPMSLQDRSQYLSLALFSQMVVSALMEYVDENKKERLKPSLHEALVSLRSVQTKRAATLPQKRIAAFTNYEHLRTLDGAKILQNWTQEIFCDLFAIRLVGPAFSFALV